jgi:hypothetical protein
MGSVQSAQIMPDIPKIPARAGRSWETKWSNPQQVGPGRLGPRKSEVSGLRLRSEEGGALVGQQIAQRSTRRPPNTRLVPPTPRSPAPAWERQDRVPKPELGKQLCALGRRFPADGPGRRRSGWVVPGSLLVLIVALSSTARSADPGRATAVPGSCGVGGMARPNGTTICPNEPCGPEVYSCPPWRWLDCLGSGAGCSCRAAVPEVVYPRFHPLPTRPAFAPPGSLRPVAAQEMLGNGRQSPLSAPNGIPLEIEAIPPAPVPEDIVRPQHEPEPGPAPEDRMTGVPPVFADGRPGVSWIFPMPTAPGAGRVARYPDHPETSRGILRR